MTFFSHFNALEKSSITGHDLTFDQKSVSYIRLVGVNLNFPGLNVVYWGSFQHEAGFEAKIDGGQISVGYQVGFSL